MIIDATGSLVCHRTDSKLDGDTESINYKWQGGNIVWISGKVVYDTLGEFSVCKPGTKFRLGPFQLAIIDAYDHADVYVCTRTDNWYWQLIYLKHRLSPFFRLIYARFILTLCVWNLAERKPFEIPSIRHIYAVKRMLTFIGKFLRRN